MQIKRLTDDKQGIKLGHPFSKTLQLLSTILAGSSENEDLGIVAYMSRGCSGLEAAQEGGTRPVSLAGPVSLADSLLSVV